MLPRLALAALAILFVLTGAALLVGRLLPPPPAHSILALNPCALPCFYGISPGTMTRAQAVDTLVHSVEAATVGDYVLAVPLADADGRVSIASIEADADGQIESVRVSQPYWIADVARLGEIILARGAPTRVFRTCTGIQPMRLLLSFGKANDLTIELLPEGRLAPDSPISVFRLIRAGSRTLDELRESFGCSVGVPWRGFAALWRYDTNGLSYPN